MKKFPFVVLALALCAPNILLAQTVNKTLGWNQGEPLAQVQGFVYTVKIDTGTPTVTIATCVAAVPPATGTKCTTPISFPAGPHTITLTADNGFGTGTGTLSGVPAQNPTNVILIVTYTGP
jgi:hypothetical protein